MLQDDQPRYGSSVDIYVQKDGQQQGPFPESRIRQGIDAGEFGPTDLAWTTGKASWQPLSALINLDVTKPPPIPAVVAIRESSTLAIIPVDLPPVHKKDVALATEPTNVPQLNPERSKSKGPFCKTCGTPYNRWSLFHTMGSGLCRRCQKTDVKPKTEPIWQREVRSPQEAYKVIRVTAIFFIVGAIFNFFLGFVWMPLLVLCIAATLWQFRSRMAAILLITISALDGLEVLLHNLGGATPGMFVGLAIVTIEVGLSLRSLQAVQRLQNRFTERL